MCDHEHYQYSNYVYHHVKVTFICVHMYINLMVYFLYSLQLCLQFSFIATCHYQGSHNRTYYTVDVQDISAIDTLNFTKSSAKSISSKFLKTNQHEVCEYIWMEDSQSMLLGPVLQCNTTMKDKPERNHHGNVTRVTCTFSGDRVCRNGDSTSPDNDRECV